MKSARQIVRLLSISQTMDVCMAPFHDDRLLQTHVERARIPSKDLLNSGLFGSHFFDINPDLEPVTEILTIKPFSSKFMNPIDGKKEHILVLGVTGSEDGQNRRQKTDFVIVIDRSGSMRYSLNDSIIPGKAGAGEPVKQRRMKMELAIEAAKGIFDILEDEEEVGVLMFDELADIIEEVKPKGAVSREALFAQLDTIEPRGGTNFCLGLSTAIQMFHQSRHKDHNQRIMFLTDACLNVGSSTEAIREIAETAFGESKGRLGVTYWGIGLSFDVQVCSELSRAHSTSISEISTSAELEQTLRTEFNYEVSPIGFDIRVGLRSQDYSISEVYGGDSDCQRSDSLLEFRTITASAVGVEGVKGSVLIVHLEPLRKDVGKRSSVEIWIEWTPFGAVEVQHQSYEYFLNDEPIAVTEKAYALSVYYRTLLKVLPERNVRKEDFTPEESSAITTLQGFLNGQRPEIKARMGSEIKIVDQLIANHCNNPRTT